MKNSLSKKLFLLLLALSVSVCSLDSAIAQDEISATITGQVTDSTGAVIPNATVTVINKETGAKRTVQTDGQGQYQVAPLQPGAYTVSVEQQGFKKYVQTLTLNTRDRRPVEVVLEAGAPNETVEVIDDAPAIQESPTGQSLISGTQVRELPLNNRDFLKLTELVPGVSSDLADETSLGLTNRTSISINGLRRNGVNFLVDGVNNTDGGSNITLLSTPTIDSIKEFKVLSSNYTAELGRSGGGAVTVVTRGGSNEFHGSLYEFVRHNRFNANSFFNNRRGRAANGDLIADVPKLRFNTFGGTFSGPVVFPHFGEGGPRAHTLRNKTFFFYSQDFRRIRRATTSATALVPTAAQRIGDFSANLGLPLFRQANGTSGTTVTATPLTVTNTNGQVIQAQAGMIFRADGRAYANNIIPNSDISPLATGLLALYPLPNSGVSGFIFSPVNRQDTRQEVIRIDHNFNDNHRLYGRYTHDLNSTQETGGLFNGINLPNVATTDTRVPGQLLAINYTAVISPTVVNEVNYSFSQNFIGSDLVGRGRRSDYANASGIGNVFPENKNNAIPGLSVTGLTFAGSTQGFQIRYRNQTIRDTLTMTRGNHTFKFGGELAFEGKNENASNNTQGSFTFNGLITRGASGTVSLTQTGLGIADFLLGRAASYLEDEFDITYQLKLGRREFFAQDTWRIRPNLTFDYGVRYQYFQPATDANNTITSFYRSLFNPARQPICATAACTSLLRGTGDAQNGIGVAGRNAPFGDTIVKKDRNNFSPRLGLSYSPNFKDGFGKTLLGEAGKTVFRMGYGFYYDQIATFLYQDPTGPNPPFNNRATFTNSATTPVSLANPAAGTVGNIPIRTLGAVDPELKTPEIQQWSVGVQREIIKNGVLDLSYVGTKGDFLLRRRDINFAQPADVLRVGVGNVNSVRPFVGYGAINFLETTAISRYHGALSSFNYRFGRGLGNSVGLSYTFSKNMTDFTNDRDAVDSPQNPLNLRAEYAEARSSRPHIFSASYVYEIPLFRNTNNAALRFALAGWQFSGITNLESGAPVSRVLATSANSGLNGNRSQLVGNPTGGLAGTIDPVSGLPFIYDPNAFANPASGTYGNSGRAIFRLPGRNQTNFTLSKRFYFSKEKARYAQVRVESFNVFNHTQFTGIDNQIGFATSGRPTATRLPRELQFALKLNF
jgi:hypothetical protein